MTVTQSLTLRLDRFQGGGPLTLPLSGVAAGIALLFAVTGAALLIRPRPRARGASQSGI
jgi:hypothetical protein